MHAPCRLSGPPRAHALLPGLLLGLLLLGVTGCASQRQQLLERSAASVAYRLPPEQLLEAARELLRERGYLILETRDPRYVRTSWRVKFDESLDVGAVRERQLVVERELEDGRFVLNAYRISYTTIGRTEAHPASFRTNEKTGVQMMVKGDAVSAAEPVLVRDLELEWQLLSRVAPSVARQLEAQVDLSLATQAK